MSRLESLDHHRCCGRVVALATVVVIASGCGASGGAGAPSSRPPAAARVFAAPAAVTPPPHVDSTDPARAGRVLAAVRAIAVAHRLAPEASYEIPELMCQLLTVPNEPRAYVCTLSLGGPGAATEPVSQRDADGPTLAKELYDALADAGAAPREDPQYYRITTTGLRVTAASLHFDDTSHWEGPPQVNVQVRGDVARAVLEATGRAGIVDDDGTLVVICRRQGPGPICAYQQHHRPGTSLSAADARALWDALVAAGRAAHYVPLHGGLGDATILNASHFSFDGTTLALALVGDRVALPPPSASAGPP